MSNLNKKIKVSEMDDLDFLLLLYRKLFQKINLRQPLSLCPEIRLW